VFDLVSTRDDVDPQTARCAQLLAAVIADAVRQAAQKPTGREQQLERNLDSEISNYHPATSLWFLFDEESPLKIYAQHIGLSAKDLREALLSDRQLTEHAIKGHPAPFSSFDRRTIKLRHRWYLAEKHAVKEATKE
jgi:hypothetical protein